MNNNYFNIIKKISSKITFKKFLSEFLPKFVHIVVLIIEYDIYNIQ